MKKYLIDLDDIVNKLENVIITDDLFGMCMQTGIDLVFNQIKLFAADVDETKYCPICGCKINLGELIK